VQGKTGPLDKQPWSEAEPPRGPVEGAFLGRALLGESIAPFRLLKAPLCVLPVLGQELLNSHSATDAGFRSLAAWLRYIEDKWAEHAAKRMDGQLRMTLLQRIDHMRGLSAQLPTPSVRVVYAASGIQPAATVVADCAAIAEHATYWAPVRTTDEGRYLVAILNSETTRKRIEHAQPKGQGGARHFDNLIWELPIPEFTARNPLHRDLARAAVVAERVAVSVALTEGAYFTHQRRTIRDALTQDGVASRIDQLVARLLG
jgi:hypothetical protein